MNRRIQIQQFLTAGPVQFTAVVQGFGLRILQPVDLLFRGLAGLLQGDQWLEKPVDQATVEQQRQPERQQYSSDLHREGAAGLRHLFVGAAGCEQNPVEPVITAPGRRLEQKGLVAVALELRLQ